MVDDAITALEKERLGLLYRLGLPDPGSGSPAAEALAAGEAAFLRQLFAPPLVAWEQGIGPVSAGPLLEILLANNAAKSRIAESDLALLRELIQKGDETRRTGAFGLVNTGIPVVCQGEVIGVSWLRLYCTQPIPDSEIAEIAELCGRPAREVQRAAERCAVLNPRQEEQVLDTLRGVRDATSMALQEHLRAADFVHQLVHSERTRALGTLSGGIAHHFNNLLSIILGYSSFVLNREGVSEQAAGALHKISDAAQRGRRLTEEILAFAGSEVEEDATCHVHPMLSSILSLIQSQTPSQVNIMTALEAEKDTVTAPPSSIHQLVFNLLTNAIDSMPGGGDLHVTSFNQTGQEDGKHVVYLVLRVTDNSGAAAAPEEDAEALQDAASDLRRSQVHGIADSLGGSVSMTLEPGQGTRVDVLLPVATGLPKPQTEPKAPQRIHPVSIWVVDDDAIFREMCRQVPGEEGHAVELIATGREMQENWAAAKAPPDLLIVDFSMPEYNGLELCSWLREEQESDVPVILVSGFSESQPDIHRALQFRKTHFLRKPFSFREMLDTITVTLGESLIGEPYPG